ncbi:MAG: cytochrome c [Candidatus Sumerlaeota bacterium]|nr:cytochrome c [Candidatus Sumerlaeota bacterium]
MPRWLVIGAFFLAAVALAPFVLIARARVTTSPRTRIHPILDMDHQAKYLEQQTNPFFRDGRAARPPVPGTVARGQVYADDHLYRGRVGGEWATTFPFPIDEPKMARGQQRFTIYCAPCHGLAGYGDGIIAARADQLQEPGWVPPASYHTDLVRQRPVGHIFNTITNGVRTMPAYGPQIPAEDRWAIVAYVRALQRSQNATAKDVPPEMLPALR